MDDDTLVNSSFSAVVNAPIEKIDIPTWCFSLGDQCRERLRIRSCCLTRTDSATTERMPPGPKSRAAVVMRWMKGVARSRISAW